MPGRNAYSEQPALCVIVLSVRLSPLHTHVPLVASLFSPRHVRYFIWGCRFDNFAGLVGGFCAVPLALVYPSAFQLKMMGDSMSTLDRVWAWTVVVCGAFGALLCTWQSLATWK